MTIKLFGALFIIVGCGGFGMSMCIYHKRAEQELHQLILALQWMICELSCRCTPLPELFRGSAASSSGVVQCLLMKLADEFACCSEPDAAACVDKVLASHIFLSPELQTHFLSFGVSLGRFDLEGQQQGIQTVIRQAEHTLGQLTENRTQRLRSYQTLGLCAGAALAILLL